MALKQILHVPVKSSKQVAARRDKAAHHRDERKKKRVC